MNGKAGLSVSSSVEPIDALLKLIKKHVISSNATKSFFARNPFPSSLECNEMLSAKEFINDVAFPMLATVHLGLASILLGTEEQINKLWNQQGLGMLVQQAHSSWRNRYIHCIRNAIDATFRDHSKRGTTLILARELYSATEIDSPSRPAFYLCLEPVWKQILQTMDRAVAVEGSPASMVDLKALKDNDDSSNSLNLRIRDIFGLEEEAFVLMVIRKYLKRRFGGRVFSVVWPSNSGGVIDVASTAPTVPNLDELSNDVVAGSRIEAEDIQYYYSLCETLEKYDDLVVVSHFAARYGVMAFPRRASIVNPVATLLWDKEPALIKPSPIQPGVRVCFSLQEILKQDTGYY